MKKILILLLLLTCSQGFAMDPPAMVWVKYFFPGERAYYFDVHEVADGGFVTAGFKSQGAGMPPDSCIFRFTDNGDLLWARGIDNFTWDIAYWVEELSDSSFIVTGSCREIGESSDGLFLTRIDSAGNQIWVQFFDAPGTNNQGNCVLSLEDGFAIAGDRGNEAWIIRTDLQGDSLWSVCISDLHYLNARRILFIDDALVVYITGINPRIVALSVEDGQLLWEADDFPVNYPSYEDDYGDMTYSTTDDGFTLVTAFYPNIVHTDKFGNVLWYYEVPYWSQPFSSSINNTMDGGYIYGGINTEQPDVPGSIYAGMVVKYDSEGNEHWRDYVYESVDLFSIRQLSSGGYIACGAHSNMGTLIRYAPETGIEEEGNASDTSIITLTPNPFSSTVSIQFNLEEPSHIELSVFDLSGRLIADLEQGLFSEGEYSTIWSPEGISSGCYLIRLSTPDGSFVKNCVFIP